MSPTDRSLDHNLPRLATVCIPGDGRCLFRSVVHGACLRLGKPSPSESHQKALADELRVKVADEFVKRRADTKWFLECDFDSYIKHIRKSHTWGGEPELLMASHVLKMPITVFMHEKSSESLVVISEYGQEYGREDPIRVLYHGYGHYDALQVSPNGAQTKRFDATPRYRNEVDIEVEGAPKTWSSQQIKFKLPYT